MLIMSHTALAAPARSFVSSQAWSTVWWAYRQFSDRKGQRLGRKLRFLSRSLFYWQGSVRWFQLLQQTSLGTLAKREGAFWERVHRPFFDCRLTAAERAELLLNHYRLLFTLLKPGLVESILNGQGWPLAQLQGKSGAVYTLQFTRNGKFDKEGGMCLQFLTEGRVLVTLTLLLAEGAEGRVIKVGGAQGGLNCRDALKQATRDLHGIQPRLLLVEALRRVACWFAAARIEAITQAQHVYRAGRYSWKKQIQMDYVALWEMCGGSRRADGLYDIPLQAPERSREIPANKRAEYRRREALYQDMSEQMYQTLYLQQA